MATEEPNFPEPQLTAEEARAFAESGKWKTMSLQERAEFQINQQYLAMPFEEFHGAVEHATGRPVYTHEFGFNWKGIQDEIFKGAEPPSFEEILGMIPDNIPTLVVSVVKEDSKGGD